MRWTCLIALSLLACNTNKNADPNADTDTDTDPPITYEEGCITVDGEGGYMWLQDALEVATDGATIALCAGTYSELVRIDKPVTIRGVGADDTLFVDPERAFDDATDATFTVTAPDVMLIGIQIEADRNAVHLTGQRTGLSLSEVRIASAGAYGIQADTGTLSVTDCTIEDARWGGILAKQVELEVTNTRFDGPTGYGISLDDGASATITDSSFTSIPDTGNSTITDGFGVILSDEAGGEASASLRGNTFIDNAVGAVFATNASLQLDGDIIRGGSLGLYLQTTTGDAVDIEISDYFQIGALLDDSDGFSFTNTTIITDPANSQQWSAGDPQGNASDGSIGLLSLDSALTLNAVHIEGNNGGGLIVQPAFQVKKMEVSLNAVTAVNNARWGLALSSTRATLREVSVTQTRNNDKACITAQGTYQCNFAVLANETDLDWSGGELGDNGTWGLVAFDGALTLDKLDVHGNELIGLYTGGGAMTLSNSTFTDGGQGSLYVVAGAAATVTNTSFINNSYTAIDTTDDGTGNIVEDRFFYSGIDVYVQDASLILQDTIFQDGDIGLFGSSAAITVSDSSFRGYNEYALRNDMNDVGSTDLQRLTLTDIGGSAIYATKGPALMHQIQIQDVNVSESRYESWTNGVMTSSTSWSSSGPAIVCTDCAFDGDQIHITQTSSRGLYLRDAVAKLSDSSLSQIGTSGFNFFGAIDVSYYSSAPDLQISNLTVDSVVVGNALRVSGSPSFPGGVVDLNGLQLGLDPAGSGISGAGLDISGLTSLSIKGIELTRTGAEGLRIANTSGDVWGLASGLDGTISSTNANGISVSATSTISLHDITVDNPAGHGVSVTSGSSITTEGLSVLSPAGSGLYIDGGGDSPHQVGTTTVSGATSYGMECTNSPIFASCDATLEGLLGTSLDCGGCP